jgi:hypothetical protein
MWLYINITIDIFLPLISHGTISKYVWRKLCGQWEGLKETWKAIT